ncbi:MAG TPA: succinic semialdehyde dehydrogenase [Solirubrobacteraceae bacterium]|nr:succinic semialdehyde dehydrogenase [Solirubrobacteraceae bacterium]
MEPSSSAVSPPPSDAPATPRLAETFEVRNPATGELIRTLPSLDTAAVAALVAEARAARPGWEAIGFDARGAIFRAAQKWLIANSDRVIETIIAENGKTRDDAQVEVSVSAQSFGFWAKMAPKYLADEKLWSVSPLAFGRKVVVRYSPLGVIGVIGPWNYPLVNQFLDAVPALMAGNAVVLKPSEVTPLTALLVAEMMAECGMPSGVLVVATGGRETGEALIDAVDMVMFTGSTRTGRAVMERAAKTLTPVSLELGGKDPMIVCADADVDRAANAATFYALNNSGQICISVERVYVEAPIYDEFVAKVLDNVKGLRQGPAAGPGEVEIGAITHGPQIEIVERHVEDARARGATIAAGGRRLPGAGRFYEPTVLTGVDHTMQCMTEETFGPTLPIMKVADVEQAIELANDSAYGLQASVYTKDMAKGERIARRLEAGSVTINDSQINYTVFDAPMGGWKGSGIGVRHGASGIRKYCHTQSILFTPFAPKRDVHMFPYKPWRSKLMARLVRFIYGR